MKKALLALTLALPMMAQAQTVETVQGAVPCDKYGCSAAVRTTYGVVGFVWLTNDNTLTEYDAQGQNAFAVHVAPDGSFPAAGPYPAGVLKESYYTVRHRVGKYGYALSTYMVGTITVQ